MGTGSCVSDKVNPFTLLLFYRRNKCMWFAFEISVIFHRFDARAMYRKSIKGLRNGSFFKDIKIIDRMKAKLKKKVFYDLSNVMLAFCCLD